MKKVAFTALFGNYELFDPFYIDPEWVYICFTDQRLTSKTWSIRSIKTNDQRKKSREVKIKPFDFFDYDVCLYIDAKFRLKPNLDVFLKNLKSDLCLMLHNKRSCLYDEGNFCIQKNKDNKETILKQLKFYREEGMPEKFGLYASGIMLRKNTKEVNNFMKLWYDQIEKFSYRDIISFSYVLWKNPIDIDVIPFRETYGMFK